MGAFLVSAVLHDWAMWGLGRGTEFASVGGFFLANGLGIVLEGIYQRVTRTRVDGRVGNAWVLLFVVGSGHLLIDAWARRGIFGWRFFPEQLRIGKHLINATFGLSYRALGSFIIS